MRVVVVGGGIAGLTVAYRLSSGPFEVVLFEASDRLGGKLAPLVLEGPGGSDGLIVEGGADSFVVRKPWAVDLCRELGLESDLVYPGTGGAAVFARGRLVPYPRRAAFGIPADAEAILRWPGLSRRGRLRAALDVYRPSRPASGDESIASLIERRMGDECARVLVGPLLAGINSGDPRRLSVRSTFPEIADWERAYGSLIRGSRAAQRSSERAAGEDGRPGRGALFATLRGGLSRMVDALAQGIGGGNIRLGCVAVAVQRTARGFTVEVSSQGNGDASRSDILQAEAVVLTTPPGVSSDLVAPVCPAAVTDMAAVPYGASAVVALAYPPGTAEHLPDSTGFIVPSGSRVGGSAVAITACTWLSRKWPAPAFADRAVIRAFVGRSGDEGILSRSDPELVAAVVRDVERLAPIGEAPEAAGVARWEMPLYEVGHLERVERIESALAAAPGVFVTGSAYRGIGIADCIRQGNETAERVRAYLEG